MTRHLGRALAALVIVATTVGLASQPASANDALITGGSVAWYKATSDHFTTMNIPLPGIDECGASTGTVTASSTGAWTATYSSHFSRVMGGEHFTVQFTMSFTGALTTTGTITGTGVSGMSSHKNNSVSCTHVGTGSCSVTVTGMTVTGTTTIGSNHTVSRSKTSTISGTSGDHGAFTYNVFVTGTQANCGGVRSLDDGSVTLTNIAFHATN